jgi:hypothetical protein
MRRADFVEIGPFLFKEVSCYDAFVMKREPLTREPDQPFITLSRERKSYDEIIDLLARGASSDEILAFRLSEANQERVRFLLERNAADELTTEEASELEIFGELGHVMQLVKLRAQEYLKTKT